MTVRPALDPDLQEIVDRTRAELKANGQLRAATGIYRSPLDAETRQAVANFVASGEYRRLADEVGHDDPELADL